MKLNTKYPTTSGDLCQCLDVPLWLKPNICHCSFCMVDSSASPDLVQKVFVVLDKELKIFFDQQELHGLLQHMKTSSLIADQTCMVIFTQPGDIERVILAESPYGYES